MLGITAIYVTHDQSEALSVSDTIVIMDKGKIVQAGSPEDIYNHPVNTFVSDFIGNANLFDGSITETDDSSFIVEIGGYSLSVPSSNTEVGLKVGDDVTLAIKPEAVDVVAKSEDFHARVDVSSFLGSITEYKVEFAARLITSIHPNTVGEVKNFRAGEEVSLRFNREFFRLYARS